MGVNPFKLTIYLPFNSTWSPVLEFELCDDDGGSTTSSIVGPESSELAKNIICFKKHNRTIRTYYF